MTRPARPAPEAFRRGVSAVVANPGLILAPVAFAAVAIAAIAGPVFLLLARAGGIGLLHRSVESPGLLRDPAPLVNGLRDFIEGLLASPAVLLGGLLGLLAALLLLTLFAAYLRAGIFGALLAIDTHAVEGAALSAFRLAGLAAVFREAARRLFRRFFALVNLYALALSFLALLLVLPACLGVFAAASERGGWVAAAFVLFVLLLPVVIGGSVGLRVLYLVACRVAASDEVDALEAVARAMSWTRASLSRVVLLYLLCLGASFVSGFAFIAPRFALSLLSGRSAVLFIAGTGLLVVVQMLASIACDLAVTGSFVSLWPSPTGAITPAGVEEKADGVPPRLM